MAIALPAFLNQANPAKKSARTGDAEIDSLTNMGRTLVGAAAATLSTSHLEIDSLTYTSGTPVWTTASGKTLKSYIGLVGTSVGGEASSQSSIGRSYELTYSVQGSRSGQAEGVVAWSIGFADVVRPSSSQPSGTIGQPTGIIRGTLLF